MLIITGLNDISALHQPPIKNGIRLRGMVVVGRVVQHHAQPARRVSHCLPTLSPTQADALFIIFVSRYFDRPRQPKILSITVKSVMVVHFIRSSRNMCQE